MWAKILGVTQESPKHHYFISTESACSQVKIDTSTYMKCTQSPKRSDCCEKCITELIRAGIIKQ